MKDNWFSDAALAKQAAINAIPDGEPVPWELAAGMWEPRVQPTAAECCNCCGTDARPEVGGEEHHGKRWCCICLSRGHHEDEDYA